MKVKQGGAATAEAAGSGDIVVVNSLKAAASRVQSKGNFVVAGYILIDQAAVMNLRFSRMTRCETACRCRRRVGRPAAICD